MTGPTSPVNLIQSCIYGSGGFCASVFVIFLIIGQKEYNLQAIVMITQSMPRYHILL